VRSFLIFVALAALGAIYLWQKHNETPSSAGKPAAVSIAQPPPAPRGPASDYNWMKRAMDRARNVTEKNRAQTKESQNP
jgi:hypothetical protein